MMTFRRILVDIDALADEHPALNRAIEFASKSQAAVTIVDVLPEVPDRARRFVTPEVEQELVDHRWGRLQAIAAEKGGGRVQAALLRGKPAIALIQEAISGDFDLVVRSHGRDLKIPPAPFGPIDMQLLRKCPCPVWLIGPGEASQPQRILAAIDASCNDPGESMLNRAIIDLALTIKELEHGELTLLYVWSTFGHSLLEQRMSPDELARFVEATRNAAAADLEPFVAGMAERGKGVTVELAQGEPHKAIPEFVKAHGIDLVVMGTVARTGLAGFLMGNTAERVLQQLSGSVLAIKPPGFASPVSGPGTAAARR